VFTEHPGPLHRVVERNLLRRGDDHGARQRERLEDRELGVAGPRRQVHYEVVELAPLHVLDELGDYLVDHRPPR